MAATTAGQITLKNNRTGQTRIEYFTMTPTADQKVIWGVTGSTFLLTLPEGETIVDIFFNNDGVTTVTNFKLLANGLALPINGLMALMAADSNISNRMPSPIVMGGNKQLQMSVHA